MGQCECKVGKCDCDYADSDGLCEIPECIQPAKRTDRPELARQVLDDVQAAIEELKLGENAWGHGHVFAPTPYTVGLSIEALRQYRKPEPCEWISYSGENWQGKKYRYFRCPECRKRTAIKSNFCSNCGRPLGGDRT